MQPKRNLGQFFTCANPFDHPAFFDWATACQLQQQTLLEPFAGSNNLIQMLRQIGFCNSYVSYDIQPQDPAVRMLDTLKHFPTEFSVCITNPPYLAKNSAQRRGLVFPSTAYQDLYQVALAQCLQNCAYVAAILPASFLRSNLFFHRLTSVILLPVKMFQDTTHPVCLALFQPVGGADFAVYETNQYLGRWNLLQKLLPSKRVRLKMQFNDPQGALGLIAIDNSYEPSIRFCLGKEIPTHRVVASSRHITRISVDFDVTQWIEPLNHRLNQLRLQTHDLFFAPFKGVRRDNRYRRRLDFAMAKRIVNEVCCSF